MTKSWFGPRTRQAAPSHETRSRRPFGSSGRRDDASRCGVVRRTDIRDSLNSRLRFAGREEKEGRPPEMRSPALSAGRSGRSPRAAGLVLAVAALFGCGDDGRTIHTGGDLAGPSRHDASSLDAPSTDRPPGRPGAGPGPDLPAPRPSLGRGVDGPSAGACDPARQTGCAAPAACGLADGELQCVTAGMIPDFGRCDPTARPDPCAPGTTCRQTNDGDYRCGRFCTPDQGCARGDCRYPGRTKSGREYWTCSRMDVCDPLLQDCRGGEACFYTPFISICSKAGKTPDGAPCEVPSECLQGSTCTWSRNSRCRKVCDPMGGSPTCPVGRCVPSGTIGYCLE